MHPLIPRQVLIECIQLHPMRRVTLINQLCHIRRPSRPRPLLLARQNSPPPKDRLGPPATRLCGSSTRLPFPFQPVFFPVPAITLFISSSPPPPPPPHQRPPVIVCDRPTTAEESGSAHPSPGADPRVNAQLAAAIPGCK
eukprot:GHVU01122781.1.p3 GENE.GHVU01122781.1~~GHVU01122781.1.p3  ORF type:complete len:140 (-),score=12.32 GHVU01122781.1:211-630(-)